MPFPGDFMKPELGSTPGTPPKAQSNPAYPPSQGLTAEQSALTIGAALQFSEDALGGPLLENETNPATTAAVSIAIDGAGDRVGLIIVNEGSNDVFVGLNPGISATNGIRLGANGGNVTMNVRDDFTLPSRRWYAISPTGASTLYVLELVRFAYTKKVA